MFEKIKVLWKKLTQKLKGTTHKETPIERYHRKMEEKSRGVV